MDVAIQILDGRGQSKKLIKFMEKVDNLCHVCRDFCGDLFPLLSPTLERVEVEFCEIYSGRIQT